MQERKRIVGIDFGLARIGIAISDETKIIATPFKTIQADKKLEISASYVLQELALHQQVHKYQVETIVVGLPLLLNGKSGFLSDEVHHFVAQLRQQTTIPVELLDERLTSVQAERSLRESQMTRKKRSKLVDVVAAVILLQNFLDRRSCQVDF